ncbi:DUF4064 domain-containing protein [Staphylococcus sp. 17KM0847]|uniref:DUF4064 domain-containing protein n=1 Tax=Staphylococcus sp. 17KM0847 TaxID=2583989 RepID=UPI0015DCCB71|nr:DUF4064 domain-containing protein [Staphylococcus sp. 17KM0847]QLK85738.1 DUF4064 domain-containing protein [Staphylococcus sp. 17KM0847]
MSENYTYQTHNNNDIEAPRQTEQSSIHHKPSKPFKRTAEKVLTWIGIVLHAIWMAIIVGFGSMMPKLLQENEEIRQTIIEQGQDPDQLATQSANIGGTFGTMVIPLILALVAVFLLRKRILSGVLLLLASLTGLFLSGSFIAAVLWLIAAIMLFVRKPKNLDQQYMVNQGINDGWNDTIK